MYIAPAAEAEDFVYVKPPGNVFAVYTYMCIRVYIYIYTTYIYPYTISVSIDVVPRKRWTEEHQRVRCWAAAEFKEFVNIKYGFNPRVNFRAAVYRSTKPCRRVCLPVRNGHSSCQSIVNFYRRLKNIYFIQRSINFLTIRYFRLVRPALDTCEIKTNFTNIQRVLIKTVNLYFRDFQFYNYRESGVLE